MNLDIWISFLHSFVKFCLWYSSSVMCCCRFSAVIVTVFKSHKPTWSHPTIGLIPSLVRPQSANNSISVIGWNRASFVYDWGLFKPNSPRPPNCLFPLPNYQLDWLVKLGLHRSHIAPRSCASKVCWLPWNSCYEELQVQLNIGLYCFCIMFCLRYRRIL